MIPDNSGNMFVKLSGGIKKQGGRKMMSTLKEGSRFRIWSWLFVINSSYNDRI